MPDKTSKAKDEALDQVADQTKGASDRQASEQDSEQDESQDDQKKKAAARPPYNELEEADGVRAVRHHLDKHPGREDVQTICEIIETYPDEEVGILLVTQIEVGNDLVAAVLDLLALHREHEISRDEMVAPPGAPLEPVQDS